MDFGLGSGFDGVDLSTITNGADMSTPLGDVSNGADPMQSSTPTGTGSGVFLDTNTQNAIFGSLNNVLNYALYRDSVQMQRNPTALQTGTLALQQQKAKSSNLLIWIAAGVLLFMAVEKAEK
jgi:hypothetical protein